MVKMDLQELLLFDIKDLTENTKENIYNSLVELKIDQIPKKNYKKILEFAIEILQYKGEQVINLRVQAEESSTSEQDVGNRKYKKLLTENSKLKKVLAKFENEKTTFKIKTKELNEEIYHLQKRIQENNYVVNDKDDSSDPLSELDRQEDLLKNISTKNKHIKRLLKDIEILEKQQAEYSKNISDLEGELSNSSSEIGRLNDALSNTKIENEQLRETIEKLNGEIIRLEGNISYLEDEKDKIEDDFKIFIEKLEERAIMWKSVLDGKEDRLESLRQKYEDLYLQYNSGTIRNGDEDEIQKLMAGMLERDCLIDELENKLKTMTQEMIDSTKLMNKISSRKDSDKSEQSEKSRSCCKNLEESLKLANNRCKELAEMLENEEEENVIKSKQAAEALSTLQAYESGESGLEKSLKKISNLQYKLSSRDKEIRALVTEVNSLHEISQENTILRKRLNIPDDMVVLTKNFSAKEKSKDKIIDRLTLKLRCSEEARLQLKIDKNELRREINELRSKLPNKSDSLENIQEQLEHERKKLLYGNDINNFEQQNNESVENELKELEEKYLEVIEENESLRAGMHEILEKIRSFDAYSEEITIDCTILEKLLHALDARSISGWYHPAMRMQNELIAVKEREYALKEKINMVDKEFAKRNSVDRNKLCDEVASTIDKTENVTEENNCEIEENQSTTNNIEPIIEKDADNLYPLIIQNTVEISSLRDEIQNLQSKYREALDECEKLNCYKEQYEELIEKMKGSGDELQQYCSSIIENESERIKNLQNERNKYDYLKEDFERTINECRRNDINNIAIISELKENLLAKNTEIERLKNSQNSIEADVEVSKAIEADYAELRIECALLKDKLAHLIDRLYSNKIENYNPPLNEELKSFMNYGIINENLQLDIITIEEYENLKKDKAKLLTECDSSKQQCKQFEDLLQIARDQIKSQQKLLTNITDNQINLRHLVADLQASDEGKFMLAKSQKELDLIRCENEKIKSELEIFATQIQELTSKLTQKDGEIINLTQSLINKTSENDLKLRFLKKSLQILHGNYCKYTPLILLVDFIITYEEFMKKSTENNNPENYSKVLARIDEEIVLKVKNVSVPHPEELVKSIKFEIRSSYLEEQLKIYKKKVDDLQIELNKVQLNYAEQNEHWKTLSALFGENAQNQADTSTQYVQTIIEHNDACTNTEVENVDESESSTLQTFTISSKKIDSPRIEETKLKATEDEDKIYGFNVKSLESQLKQAINLASMRSALLLETENRLAEAQGRIKEMEKIIENKKHLLKQEVAKTSSAEEKVLQRNAGIVESTISSLQSLLSEKDRTLSHYQELLKVEREQYTKSCENYEKEINIIRKTCNELETNLKLKDSQLGDYRKKLELLEQTHVSSPTIDLDADYNKVDSKEIDYNAISDEKIEEMFMDEQNNITPRIFTETLLSLENDPSNRQIQDLQAQIREINNREVLWEKTIESKEEEIDILKEKIKLLENRQINDITNTPDIEQFRIIIEEKDKHINDLMETLTNFHDDQQKLISDTSFYSANQVSQLGADLQRSEATNRVLNTQIEALRRQLTNLSQREKQSRDLANSLKTQLIKRPVVSIKSELNTRTKNENLQKRISQLELELEESNRELQKHLSLAEAKRAKNAADLALWEKQKRWQQNAEKLKTKLSETAANLEKTKILLASAKNTILRVEKEKHLLELRLRGNKCCRTPSCPNLLLAKYHSPDTPDSYTIETDLQSPSSKDNNRKVEVNDNNQELINMLKARIESQQRKIVAFELEGKGSNAMTAELEKLHENINALEAQNLRLEARNLQLQLDNDMLKQSNENERLQRRVKYLEEYKYSSALKEEVSGSQSQDELSKIDDQREDKRGNISQHEQTIIALRRIIEKLRVENKNLKERRTSANGARMDLSKVNDSASGLSRLPQHYAEALEKISLLEVELQLKSCTCSKCKEKVDISSESGRDLVQELKIVKEKLVQKSQLLEKAKILLTRAAAKEKSLKEQLSIWKRKCSELQNVPVIDENSE